ncbi:hypothetical protein [Candidatus Methanoprimaticola sp. MG2]|uniref:hypothetical protein n=1 Tax=Candidatus Methanoprimaticola sp. MG2 TaxID=3228838 RepID=UPI0039C6FF1E
MTELFWFTFDRPETFDSFGAPTPEDAVLPMSYWTKRRILDYAIEARSVRRESIEVLRKMKLEDLRAFALVRDSVRPTGSRTDITRCRMHTVFYRLDVDFINSLSGVKK